MSNDSKAIQFNDDHLEFESYMIPNQLNFILFNFRMRKINDN